MKRIVGNDITIRSPPFPVPLCLVFLFFCHIGRPPCSLYTQCPVSLSPPPPPFFSLNPPISQTLPSPSRPPPFTQTTAAWRRWRRPPNCRPGPRWGGRQRKWPVRRRPPAARRAPRSCGRRGLWVVVVVDVVGGGFCWVGGPLHTITHTPYTFPAQKPKISIQSHTHTGHAQTKPKKIPDKNTYPP